MAKSTKSQEVLTGTADSYTEEELSDPNPPVRVQRAMLGGEPSSVGTDSSESSENESTSNEHETLSHQELVPTTENPSDQTDRGDTTVSSTDGDTPTTETESSEEEVPYSEWTYPELQAECKERGLSARGSTEELIARLESYNADSVVYEAEADVDEFN